MERQKTIAFLTELRGVILKSLGAIVILGIISFIYAKDIIKLLQPILPLKTERTRVNVTIPAQFASKAYGSVKGFGTITKEEWRADGSWHAIVEMPAGLYAPLLEKLGELTKGTAEAKID